MNEPLDISDDYLADLAGAAAFARGRACFEQGGVRSWRRNGNKISARVGGTGEYRVVLTLARSRLEGYCDCPASEGFDFCEHCVAAALQCRADSERQARLETGSAEQRIEAFLNRMEERELKQELLALVLADPALRRQWSVRADVALNLMPAREIRKRITAALPHGKHLFRYPQVRAYFAAAEPVVTLLEQQAPDLEPKQALQLAEYALQRIHRALESIDDSGGFRLSLIQRLQNLHQALLWRLNWDKSTLLAHLRELTGGPYEDMYPEFPFAWRDLLGEEGMALAYAALQEEWDALPALPARANWEQRYPYTRLQQVLRRVAEEAGDRREVIKLLDKTATDEHHFLELAELCLEDENRAAAVDYLARARAIHKPDRQPWQREFRLERAEQRMLVLDGDLAEALNLQWRIFQGSLQRTDYRELLSLAAQAAAGVDYRGKVQAWLREQLAQGGASPFGPRYGDALAEIAMEEGDIEAALRVCEEVTVTASLLANVLRAGRHLPRAAIPLYARLVDYEVHGGKKAGYRRAVAWLREAQELVACESTRALFRETLCSVREQHKAKRSLVQLLNQAFFT